MAQYVDGFVIPMPKKNLQKYKRIATLACKVWLDHGALDYRECVLDDVKVPCGMPFTKLAKTKPSETVVFAWITYKSKAHRNSVNKKIMNDPRMKKMMTMGAVFDDNRMTYGGFKTLVK